MILFVDNFSLLTDFSKKYSINCTQFRKFGVKYV